MASTRTLVVALLLGLASCCCSDEPREECAEKPRVERREDHLAHGRPEEVILLVVEALTGNPAFTNVKRDGQSVTAEVLDVPGLDLVVDCGLGVDLEQVEQLHDTTRVVLKFYSLKRQLDMLAAEAIIGVFKIAIRSMLKSGVRFK